MMSIMCTEIKAQVGALQERCPEDLAQRAAPSIRAKVGFYWSTPTVPATERLAGCGRIGCSGLPRTREGLAARIPRRNDAD
jgi:hypothetical protein